MARLVTEEGALDRRLADAIVSAKARGCLDELLAFGHAVETSSEAVMGRDLGWLNHLLQDDNNQNVSFFRQVEAGMRSPADSHWDRGRGSVESAILPNFSNDIQYAALSLDGVGLVAYGGYSVTLNPSLIEERTSVFEENGFNFGRRHRIMLGDPIPPGYRATWKRRGDLAKAKLHHLIAPGMTNADFAGVLLTQGPGTGDGDCIEAHIHGAVHRRAITRVVASLSQANADKVVWKATRKKLLALGVEVREV